MLYNWIKIIHIVSAALLFGVGFGAVFYFCLARVQKNINDLARMSRPLIYTDIAFVLLIGIFQPLSGFALMTIHAYTLSSTWWLVTLAGYSVVAACCLPILYFQAKCQQLLNLALKDKGSLTSAYYRYFYLRCALSAITLIGLTVVAYFMTKIQA